MSVFYHPRKRLRVSFRGPEFAILGDADAVSDKELATLSRGDLPKGWITEAEYLLEECGFCE